MKNTIELGITKEDLINAGGVLWEEHNMERIYFNDSVLVKVFGFKIVENPKFIGEFAGMWKRSKVWFDCKNSKLYSNEASIRGVFGDKHIECLKLGTASMRKKY